MAARLEVSGFNDTVARRQYGSEDLFGLASTLFASPQWVGERDSVDGRGRQQPLGDHIRAALILILSCVLAGIVQAGAGLDMVTLLIMSTVGWVVGQAICSGVWAKTYLSGLGESVAAGVAATILLGSLVALTGAIVAVAKPSLLGPGIVVLLWFLFAVGIGVTAVMNARRWTLLTISAAIAVTVPVVLTAGSAYLLIVVILAALGVALWWPAITLLRRSDQLSAISLTSIDRDFLRAAALGATQAGILAAVLIKLVLLAPHAMVMPMILGTLAVVAVGEPFLILFRQWIRSARMRSRDLRSFGRVVTLEVIVGDLVVFAVSSAVVVIANQLLSGGAPVSWGVVAAAGLFSVVSISCMALNAFGASVIAAWTALLSVTSLLVFMLPSGSAAEVWVVLAMLISCIWVVSSVLADPRTSA